MQFALNALRTAALKQPHRSCMPYVLSVMLMALFGILLVQPQPSEAAAAQPVAVTSLPALSTVQPDVTFTAKPVSVAITTTAASAPLAHYTVQPGDTLSTIAPRYGMTWQELWNLNRATVPNPSLIYVRQVLIVSGSAPAVAPPAPPAPSAPSSAASIAVRTALAQVGKPYAWGAAGPGSFDCSGLAMYAYASAGVHLPHSSNMQSTMGTPVSKDALQPGDLVFFYSPVSHVAMYIGNGRIVQASTYGQPVAVTQLSYMPDYTTARRIVG